MVNHLPPPRGAGPDGRAAAGRESDHRPAQQDHRDLRPEDHPTIPWETTDRHRGHESAQPRNPQPLREWLCETVCPRTTSCFAPSRLPTMSTITAATRPSKIFLTFA